MVGASKILTVSYGTFSCTLEGFDEPFNTMKAIAEYFRDLAADDRYFGAEPPTPDAEMLHRIAEREIHRRVEARIGENGVVLRAKEDEATPAVAVPAAETPAAPAPETATQAFHAEPVPAAAPAAPVATPVAAPAAQTYAAPAFAATEPDAEPADRTDDDIAAKLSRIRAVIAAAQAAKFVQPEAEAPLFEEEVEPIAADLASYEEDTSDFESSAGVDDDFGFELDLDELPTAHAPAAPVAAPVAEAVAEEMEDETDEAREDLMEEAEEISEFAALHQAADDDEDVEDEEVVEAAAEEYLADELEEEVVADAELEEAELQEIELAEAELEEAELEEIEAPLEIAAEAARDGSTEVEVDVEEALVATGEDLADEDYEALAIATVIGAAEESEVEAPAAEVETIAADTGAEEDAELDALDLSGWRVAETAEDEEAFDGGDEDLDLDEKTLESLSEWTTDEDQDEEAAVADQENTAAEAEMPMEEAGAAAEISTHQPGFLERARARIIKIRRHEAEPIAELHADEDLDAGGELSAEEPAEAEEVLGQEEIQHEAIFAALADEAEAGQDFEDEPKSHEDTSQEDDDAALLSGIGAAIGKAGLDEGAKTNVLSELAAARDARRNIHDGRALLEGRAGDGEASVERLMEEAKSKLEGAETRRRFSAISHLKAAVAATVADRKLKSDGISENEAAPVEEMKRYREDLSKAVRPRRPSAEGAAVTRRPLLEDRPAPLVLVSEQRVDTEADMVKTASIVRPRRIGGASFAIAEAHHDIDDDDDDDDIPLSPEAAKNFAEFAERLGATNLAELLEAAAAYTATVEGLPHFSRPQILKKVANMTEEDEFNREDGLRSFGMLLRQGKIQKISRGQFTITESSRFMSEARRAAH